MVSDKSGTALLIVYNVMYFRKIMAQGPLIVSVLYDCSRIKYSL